jgi:hypothetical protein
MYRFFNCVKCGKSIPLTIKINGVKKILSNRRSRCLECKPFGKRGRDKSDETSKKMSNYHNWSDERKNEHRIKMRYKTQGRKKELIDLKGGKCIKCGYNKCDRALTFHHRVPSEKRFGLDITNIMRYPKNEVLIELDKCDLLCSNCHTELHFEIDQKTLEFYIETSKNNKPKIKRLSRTTLCQHCNKNKKCKQAKYCEQCSRINSRKVCRPSYIKLKKQIEEFGYCGTGRLYGVSDNAIRKWVKCYEKYYIN